MVHACTAMNLDPSTGIIMLPETGWPKPIQSGVEVMRQQMDQQTYFLDRDRRVAALHEVCLHRKWSLWAAHIRTNHVHAIVEADVAPENVMNAFKSYASRGLICFSVPLLDSRGSVEFPSAPIAVR